MIRSIPPSLIANYGKIKRVELLQSCIAMVVDVMNIEWDYNYYQPWSDNEWLVDEMMAMQEETLIRDEDITMQ